MNLSNIFSFFFFFLFSWKYVRHRVLSVMGKSGKGVATGLWLVIA